MSASSKAPPRPRRFTPVPHSVHIPDKPLEDGILLRVMAEGDMKIHLKLEIQESKEKMDTRQFQERRLSGQTDPLYMEQQKRGEIYKYHTAVTLRMALSYFHSHRAVVADSLFSSYATAVALFTHGMRLIGMVKSATRAYPMKFLNEWKESRFESEGPQGSVGSCTVLTSPVQYSSKRCEIAAIGYISHLQSLRTLVATTGSTDIEEDSFAARQHIAIPNIAHTYQKYCGVVDQLNQLRQGELRIEATWHTQKWTTRLFSSVLAMCLVDAYNNTIYDRKANPSVLHFETFREFVIAFVNSVSPCIISPEILNAGLGQIIQQSCNEHANAMNDGDAMDESDGDRDIAKGPNPKRQKLNPVEMNEETMNNSIVPLAQDPNHKVVEAKLVKGASERGRCDYCGVNAQQVCVSCSSDTHICYIHYTNSSRAKPEKKLCYPNHCQGLKIKARATAAGGHADASQETI